jgi:hypothetical protein
MNGTLWKETFNQERCHLFAGQFGTNRPPDQLRPAAWHNHWAGIAFEIGQQHFLCDSTPLG